MSDFRGARVGPGLAALGYARAFARWQRASEDANAVDAYLAVSEALDWAHTLDDVIARTWRPRGAVPEDPWWGWREDPALGGGPLLADTMRGLRYVRNRVHHHLADALESVDGFSFPITFPTRFQTFVWRDADELPRPDTEAKGREAYSRALGGSPVDVALGMMAETFVFVSSLLDPPMPKRRPPVAIAINEQASAPEAGASASAVP
jgi:hypothetical protein